MGFFVFLYFILRYCGFSRARGLRLLDDFGEILWILITFECDCGFYRKKNFAVFRLYSVRFCGFRPSLTPPSSMRYTLLNCSRTADSTYPTRCGGGGGCGVVNLKLEDWNKRLGLEFHKNAFSFEV